jgi:hypothetical protein
MTIRSLSEQKRDELISAMSDNFDSQDDPKVGIFWYDPDTNKLFGVSKINADELIFNSNGLKTVKALHRSWWQKEKNKLRTTGESVGILAKDYTLVPRGRIFQREDGVFLLMCGSWINQQIVSMVKNEFDLNEQQVEVTMDSHWELGNGWSE